MQEALNYYFENMNIYRSVIVHDFASDEEEGALSELRSYDFPVVKYNAVDDLNDMLDYRMYMVEVDDMTRFVQTFDMNTVDVIFAVGDAVFERVLEHFELEQRHFKLFVIKI